MSFFVLAVACLRNALLARNWSTVQVKQVSADDDPFHADTKRSNSDPPWRYAHLHTDINPLTPAAWQPYRKSLTRILPELTRVSPVDAVFRGEKWVC